MTKETRHLGFLLLLVACNGGEPADTALAQASTETATAARETIEAMRRGGGRDGSASFTPPPSTARDPGARESIGDAGAALDGLSDKQRYLFNIGKLDFEEVEEVDEGLGPTLNLDSCGGCHSQPATGGTSPRINPQVALAKVGNNTLPSFLSLNGPVREARFVRNADGSPDGGVHGLFTISGRPDAVGCTVQQPRFEAELARNNVVFRIPTPVFGAGLIEAIPDSEIRRNAAAASTSKQALGIRGRPNMLLTGQSITGTPNHNGNDGTIGRFGWKAQNKSLLIFSGEAYNVEMGITNLAFPTERDETAGCQSLAPQPNSEADLDAGSPADGLSSIEKFTVFMRFLAPPRPSTQVTGATADSIDAGRRQFTDVGCALCHTPTLNTHVAASPASMAGKAVDLYSDLLLHDMGIGLADGIQQGQASGREWRTAPLWGLGQRLFFLHDGRTGDLREAITAHYSTGSEANAVTKAFFALPDAQQQALLNFLRSL